MELYNPLKGVLNEALERVENGKGKERHGGADLPFDKQPMFAIPRELHCDGAPMLFQAVKKIYESRRLPSCQARAELLDAIVYVASCILYEDELVVDEK